MNETTSTFADAHGIAPHAALDTLEARFALRVAARLTERTDDLGPDLTERLRFAREKALERAASARRAESNQVVGMGMGRSDAAATLGRAGGGWWRKLALVVPVFALAGGLFMIQRWQDNTQITAAAEVDTALLSDDLPPKAYSDAGFAEFLKTPNQ